MQSCRTGAISLMGRSADCGASPHPEPLAEDGLVARSRDGDRTAFDHLVARHYSGIYAVARRLSPSPDDAADVAQEVFLAAWRELRRFHGRSSFRTWLHAICVRQCALALRRNTGRRWLPLGGPDEPKRSAPVSPSPDDLLTHREQDAALHAAIHVLPRAQREALVLHYFGGLTCAETGAAMGISPGSVMTHLFRARRSLRDALAWLADEEEGR